MTRVIAFDVIETLLDLRAQPDIAESDIAAAIERIIDRDAAG